ncbi:transposase [Salmonella enterica]|jgi:putative transposase|uniref:Transposase TniA n=81 Tax=root TaxID=1 RepID=A0A096GZX4_COMTE|nr:MULTISPECIES: DDE-type integrase/transposase/recombinase [Pseudomonadota]ACA14444.1 TniA [Enterobacter cloacae]EAB5117885.1 transposase [Salmonella enterica]EEJ9622446.1 transposase [Salmonella enterica subsp. enterica serovar Rubislaw]ELK0757248.1 transposase [Klebsiella oxytoca]HDK5934903.1 transposase [Klebsiella variicola]HED3066561.1 transposase [Kluyvera ascorbata]HEM7928215.1 transposase [Citrobacter farmeri]|tara:strand:- start:527 stop:2254 length:1728 start_codon:yes stop_codon:yes gene_type:complete
MTSDTPPIAAQGVATLPDEAWAQARHRTEIIGPLAALEVVGHEAADEAAQALGLSRRQVYVLIRRARQGTGLVTDLTPGRSGGGKGKGRLPEPVERIIRELLQKRFLTKQKRSLAAFHREVAQACKTQKLPVPARNTVAQRIAGLHPAKIARSRGGQDAARPLQGAGGIPPEVTMPLEQVQIDHTVIDLIVVDERDRQPIGRPYLTLAIDVFTRCVLGMVVTLEAPSAVSVGLCLAHAACDKRPWLEGLNVEMDWPMSGKPRLLYLDNAAEFKSEALRRGCEQHGIRLDYRPPGQPHYGGIVERIIGTAMQMIHDELPGTTFSNPGQRGEYDSEKMATLTLRELERWLALAVGTYHGSVHNGLLQPPAARWAEAVERVGVPAVVTRPTAFLVDFLPVIRRTLTRTGFVIDHIHYYADALKPWIARRERLPAFLIRRDPRDISRIWVLEPEGQHYLEIHYRTLSHPAVTLWEQRQALAKLRQLGREQVDESALFRMIGQMREIVTTAQKATRKARRDADRRQHLKTSEPPAKPIPPDVDMADPQADNLPPAKPFDQIEEWSPSMNIRGLAMECSRT